MGARCRPRAGIARPRGARPSGLADRRPPPAARRPPRRTRRAPSARRAVRRANSRAPPARRSRGDAARAGSRRGSSNRQPGRAGASRGWPLPPSPHRRQRPSRKRPEMQEEGDSPPDGHPLNPESIRGETPVQGCTDQQARDHHQRVDGEQHSMVLADQEPLAGHGELLTAKNEMTVCPRVSWSAPAWNKKTASSAHAPRLPRR